MQQIDNNDKNYCKYKYNAKNQMKFAKTIDFLLSPIHFFSLRFGVSLHIEPDRILPAIRHTPKTTFSRSSGES